jgi:predicted O-methyltransferase YrrM
MPQQELTMHKIEILGFKNGKWVEATAPEWFDRATDTDEAWTEAFRHHNVILVDEFDCGDSIEIYRAANGTYCVVFGDTFQALAVVFIEASSDYIQFRAQVIAPNVQLMMASKQLDEQERARQLSGIGNPGFVGARTRRQ